MSFAPQRDESFDMVGFASWRDGARRSIDEQRGDIAKLRGSSMTFDRRTRAAEQDTLTALSSVAHGAQVPARRRTRSGVLVSVAAVAVGGTIGGALALRGQPASAPVSFPANPTAGRSPSSQRAMPVSAPGVPQSPPPSSSPSATPEAAAGTATAPVDPVSAPSALTPPDPRGAAVAQIKGAVLRFVTWSHDHAGAQCPDAAALGMAEADPWGRSLRILCADQPDDQLAGVLSLGPDGLPGTPDDVASWTLGPDVTDPLRGPRWSSSGSASASLGSKRAAGSGPHAARPRTPPAATPNTRSAVSAGAGRSTDADGIPNRR